MELASIIRVWIREQWEAFPQPSVIPDSPHCKLSVFPASSCGMIWVVTFSPVCLLPAQGDDEVGIIGRCRRMSHLILEVLLLLFFSHSCPFS